MNSLREDDVRPHVVMVLQGDYRCLVDADDIPQLARRPGLKPSLAQARRIEKLRAAGVLTGCISSIEELQALIEGE